MPLYEYVCLNCGKSFELIVDFSENKEQKECPSCNSKRTNRLISSFASPSNGTAGINNSSCSSNSRFT
jgi:putative FmdB family regulatory protein